LLILFKSVEAQLSTNHFNKSSIIHNLKQKAKAEIRVSLREVRMSHLYQRAPKRIHFKGDTKLKNHILNQGIVQQARKELRANQHQQE
jgi:hypothetical protein